MLIIGFGHKARQGKDTAIAAIQGYANLLGLPTTRVGFADDLYEMCQKDYGMVGKDSRLLQRIGHEQRQKDPLIWIKRAFKRVCNFEGTMLIPDLRHLNDAEEIKNRGGVTVLVQKINLDGSLYVADDRPADHVSETELEGWNWDYRLSAKIGQTNWLSEQAITLFEYLRNLPCPTIH